MRNPTYGLAYGVGAGIMMGGAVLTDVRLLFAGFVVLGITVIAHETAASSYRDAEGLTDYDIVERVQIASEDAYDYADQLDDGETIVEDKRNAECYLAEVSGE